MSEGTGRRSATMPERRAMYEKISASGVGDEALRNEKDAQRRRKHQRGEWVMKRNDTRKSINVGENINEESGG